MKNIQVSSLGCTARHVLTGSSTASVRGTNSHGFYLQTPEDWVLFLSVEIYRGPLTLNLVGTVHHPSIETGDPVTIQAGDLWFQKGEIWIRTDAAEEWRAPALPEKTLSPVDVLARIEAVLARLRKPVNLFSSEGRGAVIQALKERQVERAVELLRPLLGRGPGLTPAGDDLVLGLLLALNRWGGVFCQAFPVQELNFRVSGEAGRKTTTLSANLIQCAAQAQADERLIRGLDGLVTGSPDECEKYFAGWGNSSGAAVLEGIQVGFQACTEIIRRTQ